MDRSLHRNLLDTPFFAHSFPFDTSYDPGTPIGLILKYTPYFGVICQFTLVFSRQNIEKNQQIDPPGPGKIGNLNLLFRSLEETKSLEDYQGIVNIYFIR